MALSNEDHKDVKKAMGKALANKVRETTRDGVKPRTNRFAAKHGTPSMKAEYNDYKKRKREIESIKGSSPADRGRLRSRVNGKLVDY